MSHLEIADTVAATVGASAMVLATQPLDTAKVNLQLKKAAADARSHPGLFRESWAAARSIVTHRGVAALWSGTVPALCAYGIEHAVLFTVYETALRMADAQLASTSSTTIPSQSPLGMAMCCAGSCVASSLFLAPADLIKCRMQAGLYRNSWQCLCSVVRNDGPVTLFSNYRSVLARDSSFFGTYIFVRELLLDVMDGTLPDANIRDENGTKMPSFLQLFLAGGFAGSAAWGVATPMDVLNSRRQAGLAMRPVSIAPATATVTTSSSISLWAEAMLTLKSEGVGALCRGSGLNALRGFVGYGVFTTVYINALNLLSSRPLPQRISS